MRFLVVKSKTIKYAILVILSAILLSINFGNGAQASVFLDMHQEKFQFMQLKPMKKVAISFDSAWGADKTLKILEILKEYNANATFFWLVFGLKSTQKWLKP